MEFTAQNRSERAHQVLIQENPIILESEYASETRTTYPFTKTGSWTLAVAVLRTGCIWTRGHPLQVNSSKRIDLVGIPSRQFTAVNSPYLKERGVRNA